LNSPAAVSIYIWIAISVGGAFLFVVSLGTMRFIYKKRHEEQEDGEQEEEEEEEMYTWSSPVVPTVVPTVVTPHVDFDSNTSVVEKVEKAKLFRRRSREATEPLFDDETHASEITNGEDKSALDMDCACKMLGCTCGLKLAQSM